MITVSSVAGMDSDWLLGERGSQKGKVPITYLELLNWAHVVIPYLSRDAGWGGRPHFLLHFSHFYNELYLYEKKMGVSLLDDSSWSEFIRARGKEMDPSPDVFVCNCSTFLKPASMPLCLMPCNLQFVPEHPPNFNSLKTMFCLQYFISDGLFFVPPM